MTDVSANAPCTAARLFDIVWETIADVLGTAATATLVRRSAKRLSDRTRDSVAVVITREGFDYRYSLPDGWQRPEPEAVAALRELARELSPLLVQLTGRVLIRRLDAVRDLQRCEIRFQERES
jgi:hypothetical protein